MNFPPDAELIFKMVLIYGLLAGVSVWFDRRVGRLEDSQQLDGIKSLLVVIGVSYTLIFSTPLIGLQNTFLLAGSFFFALAPMVWGEVARNLKSRGRVIEDTKNFLKSLKSGGKEGEG
jgi:hypothetical protein